MREDVFNMNLTVNKACKLNLSPDAPKSLFIDILRQFPQYITHAILLYDVGIEFPEGQFKTLGKGTSCGFELILD